MPYAVIVYCSEVMSLLPYNTSVSSFLREWDASSAQRRVRFLRQFVAYNQYKTVVDLEQQFLGAASLFFTRLTAWLRITYLYLQQAYCNTTAAPLN